VLLAIDTSTRHAGIALAQEGQVISCRNWYSQTNHSADLVPAISETLDQHGLSPKDLDGIACALGPGSFSALRVGLSTAKGLAMASEIPLVGIKTLELEAYPFLFNGIPVNAITDVGRQEIAVARFTADGEQDEETTIMKPEKLLNETHAFSIFCGEGILQRTDWLRQNLGGLGIVIPFSPSVRLWSLATLGQKMINEHRTDDISTLQPYYLRMPSIGTPKSRDKIAQQSGTSSKHPLIN
tara:strand:+ start:10 stop:729 length:720 start_codon:yes stop_codon:yes gene_type:complete